MKVFKFYNKKTITDATFNDREFKACIFEDCNFINCVFNNLLIVESTVNSCQFTNCRFINLEMRSCFCEKIILDGTIIRKLLSDDDQFRGCTSSEGCYRIIKICGGKIEDCSFVDDFVDKYREKNTKVETNYFAHCHFAYNGSTHTSLVDNSFMECLIRLHTYGDEMTDNELCGCTLLGNLSRSKVFRNKFVCVRFERVLGDRNTINNNELNRCYGLSQRCPEGKFFAYKKAGDCLVKLLIPADAIRYNVDDPICRCDYAKVISIISLETGQELSEIPSDRDKNFIYKVGQFCYADNFDMTPYEKCTTGIHFFIDKQDAIEY